MSQEWQRGERRREAEGDRRGEWSGDLQRRAEEEGSVTTHARTGWEEKQSQVQPRGRARAAAISSLSGSIALGGDEFSLLH